MNPGYISKPQIFTYTPLGVYVKGILSTKESCEAKMEVY